MSKRPYRDFDLPNKHLNGERHFVPPKARDSVEIERRRQLPKGVLLTEYQYRGIAIATIMLQLLQEPHDVASANQILTPSGLNTAWYSFADNAPVMRRRLKLARLDSEDPEQRPTSYMLRREAVDGFNQATEKAHRLIGVTGKDLLIAEDNYKRQIARTAGHASLVLGCVDIGDAVGYGEIQGTDFEISDLARRRGMAALQQARTLEFVIGEPPSLAGLADPDSGVSVHLRRTASNGAVAAYEEAFETMATAA